MGLVVRDIETRSTVELTEVGTHIYAAHPTTEVLSYGYCINDGPTKIWHPDREPIPKALLNNDQWVAHNAAFEIAIERNILVPRFGFPEVPMEQQVCTMAMAHAVALQGALEKVAKVLNLKNQKDAAGARLMMKLSKPRKPKKGEDPNGIYWHDDPEEYIRLDNYCMTDVAATREIYQTVPDLIDAEQYVWMLDQRINDCGFYLDRKLALAARKIAAEANPRINDELTKITNGVITAFTQVGRITEWVSDQIGETTLGKAVIEELLTRELPSHVRRVLELRLLGAQAAVAKVDALLQRCGPDGRVRGSFVYHAAGPGRWSSRGAQVHNLKRPMTKDLEQAIEIIGSGDFDRAQSMYKNPLSVIGDCIRGMIIAAPGHTLIGGDFSGIEARVTAWIAGEESKLDVFRKYDAGEGPDPYIIFAAVVFGLNRPDDLAAAYAAGDPKAREQRQVGKAGELAFGFQGGVNAFRRFLPAGGGSATLAQSSWDKRHGVGRSGGENATALSTGFTDEEIEIIKNKWRETHPRIKSFWYAAKNAVERAVQNKKPDEPEWIRKNCPIEVWCDDGPVLQIKLPSGRCLTYPNAHNTYTKADKYGALYQGEDGDREGVVFMDNASGAWRLTRMYGGLATENIVQAIARDLLAEAMLRIDAAGYKIITHVHDECVIEVPIKDAKRIKPIFTELMMQPPPWAKGLPIVVNSWVNPRYTK